MKRNMLFLHTFCLFVLTSCSDVTDGDDNALPDGKYPVTFTAVVEGLTTARTTVENTWSGNEEIAVQVGETVKKYVFTNNGGTFTLQAADGETPFYWQSKNNITVNAWYPYSATKPAADGLKVKADQSRADNYQASDYLEVSELEVSFENSPVLNFNHRTAQVVVKLERGEGLLSLTDVTVTFVNQQGVDSGTEVTSKKKTEYDITSYMALLCPQQMQNKQFIKVTVGTGEAARDYYYTPATGDVANLEVGKRYTYKVKVAETRLEVTVTENNASWTDTTISGGSIDNQVTFQITAPQSGVAIAAVSPGQLTCESNGPYTLSGGNKITVTISPSSGKVLKSLPIKGIYEKTPGNSDASGNYVYTYTLKSDILISEPEFE